MNSHVCIILLNWNHYQDTITCVRSVQGLTHEPRSVIVVDNASSNDSVAQIRAACPGVMVLESRQNLGFAGGNNIGIRSALEQGADFIWLLNSDTVVPGNALSEMLLCMGADPAVGAVGSMLVDYDEPHALQAWGGGRILFETGRARHLSAPGPLDYITGASLLVRRAVIEQVGLLDDQFFMYWEDADFGLRVKSGGWKLAVAEQSTVYHKESATLGKQSARMEEYLNRSAMRFFVKHSRYRLLAALIGVTGRFVNRLREGRPDNARAILRGALSRQTGPIISH